MNENQFDNLRIIWNSIVYVKMQANIIVDNFSNPQNNVEFYTSLKKIEKFLLLLDKEILRMKSVIKYRSQDDFM